MSKEQAERLFRDIFSIKVMPRTVYNENQADIELANEKYKDAKKEIYKLHREAKALEIDEERSGTEKAEIQHKIQKYKLELAKYRNQINSLTFNIGMFRGINNKQEKEICGEKIYVIPGRYDKELGFEAEKKSDGVGMFW